MLRYCPLVIRVHCRGLAIERFTERSAFFQSSLQVGVQVEGVVRKCLRETTVYQHLTREAIVERIKVLPEVVRAERALYTMQHRMLQECLRIPGNFRSLSAWKCSIGIL